jgi:hypothetical protein
MINRYIEVTFQKEGVHKYPAALTDPKLRDVEFLGYPHRHMFHFRVRVSVTHNDRDIEFILFKRELEQLYQGTLNIDYRSCEMIAEELIEYVKLHYPGRYVEIGVSEDGENGAIIQYAPQLTTTITTNNDIEEYLT